MIKNPYSTDGFPERLQKLLDHEKIKQKDYAETVYLTPASVNNYLKSLSMPNGPTTLISMMKFPKINHFWLLFGIGEMIQKDEDDLKIENRMLKQEIEDLKEKNDLLRKLVHMYEQQSNG